MRAPALAAALLIAAPLAAPTAVAQQAAPTELTVHATDFQSADGQAMFVLLSSAEAFERMRDGAGAEGVPPAQRPVVAGMPIDGGASGVRFTGLAPGEYAVMVVHDTNRNQTLDRRPSPFGKSMPAEDLGVSNDYRISFPPRPPRWDDIKFAVRPGANSKSITMGMMR
ncbi:MAG: DUF2141 domain-containing protein [Planctomycetota bacterium]